MTTFSETERHYLGTERLLARLATVGPDGMPHIAPVGWRLDGDIVEVSGRNFALDLRT